MNIYLVRHAIAVDRDACGDFDDAARRLTAEGIERMRRNVRALAALDVALDAIWTSPLVRARETADLLAELPGFCGRIDTVDELAGGRDHELLIERVAAFGGGESLALVGHEPDMGELASALVCGSPHGLFRFKKGGVACIELVRDGETPLRGELRWLLTPKQMRQLA